MRKHPVWLCLIASLIVVGSMSCNDDDPVVDNDGDITGYPSTLATKWFDLGADLSRVTPGFGPGMVARTMGYSGLALFESIAPAEVVLGRVFSRLSGQSVEPDPGKRYYWPAAANAALAHSFRRYFAAASDANRARIDSLENAQLNELRSGDDTVGIGNAIDFGVRVAEAIFEWSKSDKVLDTWPPFSAPPGPGKWVPTPPAFAPAVVPYWGESRSFVPGIADMLDKDFSIPYDEKPGSVFYAMVDSVYQQSKKLTLRDTLLIRTWADLPINYNGPAHMTKVLTSLIRKENKDLPTAAVLYARHGMAMFDATVLVFRMKYKYNLVRPITYIRNVMGHTNWNTVVVTPPHPEYPSAHSLISGAVVPILENDFGTSYAFTDQTHNELYGSFEYKSIDEYGRSSGYSRFIAGIHYLSSVHTGYDLGKKVGAEVLKLPF
ncbi:vanadium-dependent haloperoxidase [Flavihumibacter rivuli]|uniref:vanadium-dependent haloperoxidase n=1 Tax=Flavihumibacter rivuli TaxID=2838156 RepID=UPI001BDDE151|nr:vanadium-dependent haloperoxidase [Flavihumibacter rivuli]ULQ57768.1 vanadium-dependent haloperoxidase [Flavihumibacter rivuli]